MVAFDLQLPIDATSPSRARHALDGMTDRIPDDVMERFQLAVTELVTNVIRHGRLAATDAVRLLIQMFDDHLRVELANVGRPFRPQPRAAGPGSEGGRGLMLVEHSADRWGVEKTDGVDLWFEIDLPSQEGPHLSA